MTVLTLTHDDFCHIFGVSQLSKRVMNVISAEAPMSYRIKSDFETKEIISEILAKINDPETREAGPDFKSNWESNWRENLLRFDQSNTQSALIPAFLSESDTLRFCGNYIEPLVKDFEMRMVRILRCFYFEKYFQSIDVLHEFGAGTGFNLVQFLEMFPKKVAWGYDWSDSSVDLIRKIGKFRNFEINARLFDMFNPDYSVSVGNNSGLLTVGAMEQLGLQWKKFLDFIVEKKFSIYVNIETVCNDYDTLNPFETIKNKYIRRRNWLQGYHSELKRLEGHDKIEILEQRVIFGSKFHDSWTVTTWKVKSV